MSERADKGGRVAIVYPHSNLDSVPSLYSTAVLLAEHGYRVDVFTRFDNDHIAPNFEDDRISILAGFEPPRLQGPQYLVPGRVYRPLHLLLRHWLLPYKAIIGVDPLGLVIARSLTRWVKVPLIYYSLELLLSYEVVTEKERKLKALEQALSREAAFTIIQDEERGTLLARDNCLAMDQIITVPNGPLGAAVREPSDYWRERFNLSRDSTIILHTGSIGDWACTRQLIKSTRDWPNDWVLICHTRQRMTRDTPVYAAILPDLARTDRVLFSTEPVSRDEYPRLVRSADIGIAFYCVQQRSFYEQDNIRHIGLSSGKLAYYLQSGLPVVVTDIPSLRHLVTSYGCGEVVVDPSATRAAIERVLSNHGKYSQGAMFCFNREFDFADSFDRVLAALEEL